MDADGRDPGRAGGVRTSATLIGDVVGSKRHADRAAVQDAVRRGLARVNRRVPALQALDFTIGDEFQGAYERLADAMLAALLVRLELLPAIDTRYGLGFGTYEVFDDDRRTVSQDGPGWWAARAAITRVKEVAEAPRTKHLSTYVVVDRSGGGAPQDDTDQVVDVAAALNSFLLLRDLEVSRLSERGRRLLQGLFEGMSQVEMAQAEGITQPAVSQQLARSGAYSIQAGHAAIGGLAP